MKMIILIFVFHMIGHAYGQEQPVIYQYKKYEKFDLGNLEVRGELIAPGDISVRERDRRRFELDLYSRKDFDPFIKQDVDSLR